MEKRTADSLKLLVNTSHEDTSKINYYKDWDDIIYSSNPQLDFEINEKIAELAQKNLDKKSFFNLNN